MITITNEDNMELMARYPDKYFDLAIVDPPYGIGASEMTMGSGKNKKYKKGKNWDNETPNEIYFNELFRVSKNQIIFGGNYFNLPLTKSWIFWDKGINGDCDFADGELAWTSFNKVLRIAPIRYKGFLGADLERIHPTQKPVAIYKWLLDNYAKQGDRQAIPLSYIFEGHHPKAQTSGLRRRILREGILQNKCSICGIEEWMGRPIVCELDHVNGNRHDHRLENLRLLCPNCHSQTDTYCGRNKGRYK